MKAYYRWYRYNKENDMVEVTKDLFPEGSYYEKNGWKKMESSKLIIKEKENGKK